MSTNGSTVLPPCQSLSIEYCSTSLSGPFSAVPITSRYQPTLAGEGASFCFEEPRHGVNQRHNVAYDAQVYPSRFYGRYNHAVPSPEMTVPNSWTGNVQFEPASGVDDDIHENNFRAFDF